MKVARNSQAVYNCPVNHAKAQECKSSLVNQTRRQAVLRSDTSVQNLADLAH